MSIDPQDAVDAATAARDAAEAAQRAAEEAVDLAGERNAVSDEQVARGVEAAIDQQKLKDRAVELEKEGWTVVAVEPGQIVLAGKKINWWLHGILPFFTVFLSLIWTAKVAKRTGTITLTLDGLGRVRQQKS